MKHIPRVAAAFAVAVLASPAVAQEGDTFRPYIGYARYYDSNIYRLAESEYALVSQRSDQYGVLSAGLNVDWRPGRQQVLASAGKTLVRFQRLSQLDYDGSDYSLKWNWQVGNYWKGLVGATRTISQSNFSDVSFQINNQVTRTNRFAQGDWWFHPRWSAGLGAGVYTSENSTSPQTQVDYEESHVLATVGYATPKGSRLRVQVKRAEGEFPNRPTSYLDRAYTQTELNVLGDWAMSGKLTARGRAGYVRRANDTVSQRDFAGVAGRMTVEYTPTGKFAHSGEIFREVGNSDDINASYQVTTGARLSTAWFVSAKSTVRGSVGFDNRQYKGQTGLVVPGVAQREEDTWSGTLSLTYMPVKAVSLDVGVQSGERSSNFSRADYSFHGAFISMRADF